jgi:hypothetical protein
MSCLAVLAAACSLSQPRLELHVRAPAGWESFCFPVPIAFAPGTDRVSPGTERAMPVVYEAQLRRAGWLQLVVDGGPDASDRAARSLANRRARAALRLLRRLGVRADRVEVHISYVGEIPRLDRDVEVRPPSSPGAATPMDWAANVMEMIPPEEVERYRALERENPALSIC